ncbi:MAG: hypothetical protein ABIE22_02735 [archaeon]
MKNKKGQAFTLFAIGLVIFLFVSYSTFSLVQDRRAIKTRISTMNNFLYSIEEDFSRQLYIFGFRSLLVAEDYTSTSSPPKYITDLPGINNANDFFNLTFHNYTVLGGNYTYLLRGSNYDSIIENINEAAEKINVEINFTNEKIEVTQEDPWNIVIVFSANMTMKDKTGLASWNRSQVIRSPVSILGFKDPLFIVETQDGFESKINLTMFEDGGYYDLTDNSNLTRHCQYGYYSNNTDAPSFLSRLEGDTTASDQYGIERLIYYPSLPDSYKYSASIVDHEYFSSPPTTGSLVTNMPAWFLLDTDHTTKYTS